MPVLDNARHEAFAQAIVKGMSADAAYQHAGFRANRSNAARLNANEHVRSRVAELQQMAVGEVIVTREWIIAKLVENAQSDNVAGSNKALELLGKEHGMFVERSENVNTNYNISDEPLTDDEWAAEHATQH